MQKSNDQARRIWNEWVSLAASNLAVVGPDEEVLGGFVSAVFRDSSTDPSMYIHDAQWRLGYQIDKALDWLHFELGTEWHVELDEELEPGEEHKFLKDLDPSKHHRIYKLKSEEHRVTLYRSSDSFVLIPW